MDSRKIKDKLGAKVNLFKTSFLPVCLNVLGNGPHETDVINLVTKDFSKPKNHNERE